MLKAAAPALSPPSTTVSQVWVGPGDPNEMNPACQQGLPSCPGYDFSTLYQVPNTTWPSTAANSQTVELQIGWLQSLIARENASFNANSVLVPLAQYLVANGKKVAWQILGMDFADAVSFGFGCNLGPGGNAENVTNNDDLPSLNRWVQAGGTIDYLTFDNAISHSLVALWQGVPTFPCPGITYTYEQLAGELSLSATILHQKFPKAQIGFTEALGYYSEYGQDGTRYPSQGSIYSPNVPWPSLNQVLAAVASSFASVGLNSPRHFYIDYEAVANATVFPTSTYITAAGGTPLEYGQAITAERAAHAAGFNVGFYLWPSTSENWPTNTPYMTVYDDIVKTAGQVSAEAACMGLNADYVNMEQWVTIPGYLGRETVSGGDWYLDAQLLSARLPGSSSTCTRYSRPPSIVTGGSYTSNLTQISFVDPRGAGDISLAEVDISSTLGGLPGCNIGYEFGAFWLSNDSGTALLGPLSPGSSQTLSNSSCSLSLPSVALNGNVLTMNLPISFSTTFSGQKSFWGYVADLDGASAGWSNIGSWQVSPKPPSEPVASFITQYGGITQATFVDPKGAENIANAEVYISRTLGGSAACNVSFQFGQFWLTNDAGTGLLGPLAPGSNGTLANSSCTLTNPGVIQSGNTLALTLPLSFYSSAFSGSMTYWGLVWDASGATSGFVKLGQWSI